MPIIIQLHAIGLEYNSNDSVHYTKKGLHRLVDLGLRNIARYLGIDGNLGFL